MAEEEREEARRSRWTIRLGTLMGIPIRIHLTFALLIVWLLAWASGREQSLALWAAVLGLVVLCRLLHELGHALAALFYGLRTREIVLYPVGGVARLEGSPRGLSETAIALAGPAVNLVLMIGFLSAALLSRFPLQVESQRSALGVVLVALFYANLLLFLFNLVPAFPMDGGRALRGLLTVAVGEDRATRAATFFGQAIALLFALIAVFGPLPDLGLRFVLLLVAFFVLAGANQERVAQRTRSRITGRTAGEAMMTRFERLAPQDSLEWAARLLLATHQRDFPVVDAWGRLAGTLERGVLLGALSARGAETAVLEVMEREPPTVTTGTALEEALKLLHRTGVRMLPVVDEERLVGLLSLEKVGQMVDVLDGVRDRWTPEPEG